MFFFVAGRSLRRFVVRVRAIVTQTNLRSTVSTGLSPNATNPPSLCGVKTWTDLAKSRAETPRK